MKEITSPFAHLSRNRSDIQVLRGLAVLAVIFYHLGLPIDGGFLGVDSFFVISGFVITGTLLRSKGTIKNRILLFYKKRVRRILPLSIYITLLTMLASFLFLPSIYLRNYLLDAISSILMVANIRFANNGVDYLQQTLYSSPFLHFWSLGVEEQFYLIWPFFLLYLFRYKTLYYITLPLLFVASMITSLIYPAASFFSPTSRAWEFLVGAFVATLPPCKLNKKSKLITLNLSWLVVINSFIFLKPNNTFIQIFTLPLILSVGTLIYIGFANDLFKPIESIGDISYSLYLIHWPVIAIMLHYSEKIDNFLAIEILLFVLILAKLLTDNLENPIRFKLYYFKSSKFYFTLITPILALGILAWFNGPFFNQKLRPYEINNASPVIYENGCHTNLTTPQLQGCDYGDLNSKKLIMLVGDSHAAQWFPGFESAALKNGFKLRVATKSGCPAILLSPNERESSSNCTIWERNILQYINTSNPNLVIISNLTEDIGDRNYQMKIAADQYLESLNHFISKINRETKIAVIGDTPYPRNDSVTCLSLNWQNFSKCDLRNSKTTKTEITKMVGDFRTTYFDSRPLLCEGETCPSVINEKNVYRDGSHLSLETIGIQEILAKQILNLLN